MARSRLLVLALISIGCGRDNPPQTPDASVSADGPSDTSLTLPADTWTWIPVAGSKCVHGAETGIAINPHPGATRLLVFFQGGGSCTHCWGKTEDDRVGTPTHYDAASFAVEPDVGNGGAGGQLLLRRDAPDNPLADANLVFIPYCTGDLHAGTATRREIGEDGLEHEDTFWGAIDLDLFLQRLVPAFPTPSRVWIAGSSAGGMATTFSYDKVRTAFGVRTDVINDSGEPIVPAEPYGKLQAEMAALWGITMPAGCTGCTSAFDVHQYNRRLDPSSRFAVLSFDYDAVIAAPNFGTPAQNASYLTDFTTALHAFADGLDANAHALTVSNTPATANHVLMNKPHLKPSAGAWLKLMVEDSPSWDDLAVGLP